MNRSISTPLALLFASLTFLFAPPAQGQILDADFESGGLPPGWQNPGSFTGEEWLFDTATNPGGGGAYGAEQDHTTGSGFLAYLDDSVFDFSEISLLTPSLNLNGTDSTGLTFWYQNAGPDTDSSEPLRDLSIDVSVDGGNSFATINSDLLVIDERVDDWTQYTVSLTNYTDESNVVIRFQADGNADAQNSEPSLDDVIVAEGLVDDGGPPPFVDTHVFTVDDAGDAADDTAQDGQCLTADSTCTLRAALAQANANPNRTNSMGEAVLDSIRFGDLSSGQTTITPQSALPTITEAVILDGATAPGYDDSTPNAFTAPVVVLDGNDLSDPTVDNLVIGEAPVGCIIRGMAFNRSPGDGLKALSGANSNHTFQGNFFGVAPDGTTPQGNDGAGLRLNGPNNLVGQRAAGGDPQGRPNLFGANGGVGLQVNADNNTIYGNYVGTNPAGDDLGNGGAGVVLSAAGLLTADDNDVGAETAPNYIAYNGGAGVALTGGVSFASPPSRGNAIRFNRIHDNAGIGIDIGDPDVDGGDGVTANDPGDGDGADLNNKAQNFPTIANSTYAGATATITYTVDSAPSNSAYPIQVDFYLADDEQSAEGQTYLGTDLYELSDAQNEVTVTISLPDGTPPGGYVVGTATDAESNTSEFTSPSEPLPVELAGFSGHADGPDAAVLSWRTLSEDDNAGFRLERKRGKTEEWTEVAFVESKAEGGTSQGSLSYQFRASGLDVGTHTFRLRQVDIGGGDQIVGDPVDVELSMASAYTLEPAAPNPFREESTLSFTVRERQSVTVALYNTLGRRVRVLYDRAAPAGQAQTLRLRAGSLASGMYLVRLTGEDFTATEQVVLVR